MTLPQCHWKWFCHFWLYLNLVFALNFTFLFYFYSGAETASIEPSNTFCKFNSIYFHWPPPCTLWPLLSHFSPSLKMSAISLSGTNIQIACRTWKYKDRWVKKREHKGELKKSKPSRAYFRHVFPRNKCATLCDYEQWGTALNAASLD